VTGTFDAVGNRVSMRDNLGMSLWMYDWAGRVTSETDARGNTQTHAFDAVGNEVQTGYSDGMAANMRAQGLRGTRRGKQFVTTRPDAASTRPPDHVQRCFRAERPKQLWVVDFTYVPTWSGMAFTAFVTDVFSRRIVGWRTMRKMPTDLPLDALEMALWVRERAGQNVTGVIQHSDAGVQSAALRYSERLADVGAIASIGTVGDSYDNALAETVVGLYKTECVKLDGPFRTADELQLATLSWVHWFNEDRLHSSIGYRTPTEMEDLCHRENIVQEQPLPGELTLHQTRGDSMAPKISGCWRSLATLQRHCRIRSNLTSSRNHGVRAIDAVRDALTGNPLDATDSGLIKRPCP
jgi:putative transposase